jgi:hypothetical protein
MPSVFVQGPSVRPNFGTPEQFISNITDSVEGFGRRRLFADRTDATAKAAADKLELEQRKQTFTEGAPQRAADLKIFNRAEDNKRAKAEQAIIDGSGGSFIDPFLSNPETKAYFDSQGINDPAEQRKIVEQLAKDKKSAFNDPTKLGDQVYQGVLDANGTATEAEAARKRAIAGSFATMPTDLAKALFAKHSAGGAAKSSIFGGKNKAGGSTTPLSAIPGQSNVTEARKEFFDTYDVEGGRLTIPGTDIRFTDAFDHDVTKDDVISLEGEFATELRPEIVHQTLGSIMESGDGTSKFDIRKGRMTPEQRADFLALGQQIEAKSNQARGAGGIFGNASLADIQAYEKAQFDSVNAHNLDVAGRTTPQAADFATRLAALRSSQGGVAPQIDPRQGGNQGGAPVVAPGVTGDGGQGTADDFQPIIDGVRPGPVNDSQAGSGSDTLDALLAPAAAAPVQEQETGAPGTGDSIFPADAPPVPIEAIESPELQAQLAEAQQRISIFGNGTPDDKKLIKDTNAELKLRQEETRINEITVELKELPRPDQRTLSQTAYARSLEKELRDLK